VEWAHEENSESTNLIYSRLVDYPPIKRVFRQIESINDIRLTVGKTEMRLAFQRISGHWLAPVGTGGGAGLPVDWRRLSPQQLAVFSQEVVGDVCQFVTAAILCYRTIASFRPLNAEEQQHGQTLRQLLKSTQELIPAKV
jgi:hypothetical protein